MEQRLKDLLSDLGRRTLRGVKPCPKCGTYNGTRGFSCKNKSCDVVFKAADERKKKTTEACRINTGIQNIQIFSVRLRDKGPDYRAFVQVTTDLVDNGDGNFATTQNAQCFVEMCPKNNAFSLLPVATCQHIQATMNCHSESEILPIKPSLIHSLNIPLDLRDELWNLVTDQGQENQGSEVSVVQRVSKTIFIVKCFLSNKFPLGFLHCSFAETRNKNGNIEKKFLCPCRKVKPSSLAEPTGKECVHFYACIVAFISDEKLTNEFSYHIQASNVLAVTLDDIGDSSQRQLVVHFEVLPSVSDDSDLLCSDVRVLESLVLPTDDGTSNFHEDASANVSLTLPVGINMNELLNSSLEVNTGLTCSSITNPENITQLKSGKIRIPSLKRNVAKPVPDITPIANPAPKKVNSSDENSSFISFQNWLASVTERINQTMHFQMTGTPDPLVYQIPHAFFDCLRERISSGARKKRLPNSTTVFQRKDAPPFGTLTKYTWHLHNPLHVKHIFDTPLVQLELTRSFVENHDGTYDVYVAKDVESSTKASSKSGNYLPTLKPLELRTYLRIGTMDGDYSLPIPFTIEWIPDILTISKYGELSIQFQFGHQRHPVSERNKRPVHSSCCQIVNVTSLLPYKPSVKEVTSRKKKMKLAHDSEVKDLQNLKLDYSVAPLNDTEFQELTKSVP